MAVEFQINYINIYHGFRDTGKHIPDFSPPLGMG